MTNHWSMKTLRWKSNGLIEGLLLALTLFLCRLVARADAFSVSGAAGVVPSNPSGLTWASDVQEQTMAAGQAKARFSFRFTNETHGDVLINSARSSCFCTVPQLPETPWRIAPGTNGSIEVFMDLAGKQGTVEKPVYVQTSQGSQVLTARVHIPSLPVSLGFAVLSTDTRVRNLEAAMHDRQKVFRDAACAKCHAEPARDKTDGHELYAAVCGVCHDSANRAAMVPDLRGQRLLRDAAHWRGWIGHSRPNSLMPAFAQSEGGPLDDQQVEALVRYGVEHGAD